MREAGTVRLAKAAVTVVDTAVVGQKKRRPEAPQESSEREETQTAFLACMAAIWSLL